jgi:DNA-binding transcriptional regulator LsrR (DeoR family)
MPDQRESRDAANFRLQDRRRDLAFRAAWLYYVAGNTQDQLASKLNVSRQAAQRLVATAVADGLITFRIDHPIRACVELEEALRARFPLYYVEVVPGDADLDGVVQPLLGRGLEQSRIPLQRQADHPAIPSERRSWFVGRR